MSGYDLSGMAGSFPGPFCRFLGLPPFSFVPVLFGLCIRVIDRSVPIWENA